MTDNQPYGKTAGGELLQSSKRPNIILTGFMGTGKTTVGKLLARQLNYGFVDTDVLIQSRAGKTVQEIFQNEGEAAFRALEAAVARELGGEAGLVISTGGKLMLDPDNAVVLGRSGWVFCLSADPQDILDRVSADDGPARPLLAAPDPLARIGRLMQERSAGYGKFPQIMTSGKTPEMIARRILEAIQADPARTAP